VFFHADGSSRTQEIKDELASSIGRFRGNGAKQEVNAAEFARYITAQQSTPQDRAVLQDLRKIQELREQMHKLGITETEAASADALLSARVTPQGSALGQGWLITVLDNLQKVDSQEAQSE
jgi:hypothetical protein